MVSLSDQPQGTPSMVRLFALIFLPFALGYFFSYLYRTVNAVIGPDLAVEISLSPGELGLLTSAYFITFAAAQIPVGIYLDSHGPRRVVTVLLLIAAIGAFVFSIGDGLWSLMAGRALIGLGVAACLMGSFKAMSEWCPGEKLPFMNGLVVAFGGLGAMVATAPTEALVSEVGWRYGFVALSLATVVVAAAIWFVVPERERAGASEPMTSRIGGMLSVYRSGLFWRVAPLAALSQGGFLAFQTLWAGPWLRDIAGLDPRAVSFTLLAGAAGFVIGNLVVGLIAERLMRRNIPPLVTAAGGMALFILVQLLILFEWTAAPAFLWAIFGATGTTGVVIFAVLARMFPSELAGRASTAQNLLIFGAAFALQWGMGEVINIWPVAAHGTYAVVGYRAAIGLVIAFQVLAFAWMLIYRPRQS